MSIPNDYSRAAEMLRLKNALDMGTHPPPYEKRQALYTFTDVAKSHAPKYMQKHTEKGAIIGGEKTKVSPLVAHWFSYPTVWHETIASDYDLDGVVKERFYNHVAKSLKPIHSAEGDLLWEPMGIVMHTERKHSRNKVAPIRIMNYTREPRSFHTITFETINTKLVDTVGDIPQDSVLFPGKQECVGLIRHYPKSGRPGYRPDSDKTYVIRPANLTFDVEEVISTAVKRYS